MTLFAFFILSLFSFNSAELATVDKTVDIENSMVTWKGYKVLGSHEGTINLSSGNLSFDGDVLTGGKLMIDMTSIKTTDLQGGGAAKLEGHLKSPDFFGVESNPTATIEITKVISRGKVGDYKIVADLTIKNITKQIKFDATVGADSAMADIKIDRSEFDVKYGSGSFFDNLGDNTIYDEFDISVALKY